MKLIVVRHGKTASTIAGKLQGWNNEPLLSESEAEVVAVAEQLKDDGITAIVASPSQRAKQTAAIIAGILGMRAEQILADPRFMERNFGTLTGLTWSEVERETGQNLMLIDRVLRYDYTRFEGESHKTVRERIRAGVDNLVTSFAPNDTLLLVTHGGVIRHLRELYGSEEEQDPTSIDSINRFVVNATFHGPTDAQL